MSDTNQLCPICGGKKSKGKTTFSADLGSGIVVVRDVKARICWQCGEEWIDDATRGNWNRLPTTPGRVGYRWKSPR